MAANGAPTLRSGAATPAATRATGDAASTGGSVNGQWGIFLNGALALAPDSIMSVEYDREWSLLDYPIEGGSFETFNKVARPFEKRVRVTKGGSATDRARFMDQVEALGASLSLYDVVTPEKTYLSVNVERFGYGRSAREGATLLVVDLILRQVRVTAVASFTQVANPASASPVSGGTVQPAATPAPVKASVSAAVIKQASLPLLALKGGLR